MLSAGEFFSLFLATVAKITAKGDFMPEHDKEPKDKHAHPHEMPPCPCRHGRPLGWIIAMVVVSVLLLVSACFNVYFITSRLAEGQQRAATKSRQLTRPDGSSRQRQRTQDDETKKKQKSDTSTEQQQ